MRFDSIVCGVFFIYVAIHFVLRVIPEWRFNECRERYVAVDAAAMMFLCVCCCDVTDNKRYAKHAHARTAYVNKLNVCVSHWKIRRLYPMRTAALCTCGVDDAWPIAVLYLYTFARSFACQNSGR